MRTISKVKGRKGEIYKKRFDIKEAKKENLIEFDDIFVGKEKRWAMVHIFDFILNLSAYDHFIFKMEI